MSLLFMLCSIFSALKGLPVCFKAYFAFFCCFQQPKSSGKKRSQIRASTADEAIGKMLEQKKISTKINYDVLKDLNIRPSASPARKAESVKSESSGAKLTRRSTKPAQTPPGLSVPLSTLGKR